MSTGKSVTPSSTAVRKPPDGERNGASPVRPMAGRPRRRRTSWRERLEIAVLTGPALLLFVTFVILPVGLAGYYGFYKWSGFGKPTNWVGFQNYVHILTDPKFHRALEHNVTIVVLSLLIQGPVAILIALLMNRKIRGRSIIRVLIFVPWVVSEVIAGTAASLMLATDGAVNDLLTKIGPWSLHGRLAVQPEYRDLDIDADPDLEVPRVRGHLVHGRDAEHTGGSV